MSLSQSLVKVSNLVRRYGDHVAVDHISFELNKGDILGFLGPNGAGKSTSMQMLCGVLAPTEGQIQIDGIDLLDDPKAAKRALGYLPEQPPVYRDMTVDEYLCYCAQLHRIAKADVNDALATARRRCGLDDVADRLIGNLSKGYQQRVGIAQAIIHSPKVIVLDEPTVGLDPIQIREIRDLIAELGKEHGIILSTHILPEVQAVCNRVQIINQGALVFESSMQQVMDTESGDQYSVSFGGDVELSQMKALDCIDQVEVTPDGFSIRLNASADKFVQQVTDNDWKLIALVPQQHSLEQIFVRLAHEDSDHDGEAA